MDRWFANLFGEIVLENWGPEMIPTAAFLTAFCMSMATGGASRGTAASVLLPMAVNLPAGKMGHEVARQLVTHLENAEPITSTEFNGELINRASVLDISS